MLIARPEPRRSVGSRLRPWLPDLVFFGIILALVVTWVVGIPRFGSPDEPAHVFKAYGTAHGQLLGDPAPTFSSNYRFYDGPPELGIGNILCYVFKEDIPAGCEGAPNAGHLSTAATYPPYYYGLVGGTARLVGQDVSVRAFRLVSAFSCTVALAAAFALLRRSRGRRWAPLTLISLTPMALFMMASVNPNSIEIAGFILIWALLVRMCTDVELSPRFALASGVVSGAIVMSRTISVVWLVCVAFIALIAVAPGRRRQLFRWPIILRIMGPLAVSGIASLVWLRYSSFQVSDDRAAVDIGLGDVVGRSIDRLPEYYRQAIGILGWLDTRLPFVVYAGWAVALIAVALITLIRSSTRDWLAVAAVVAIWLGLPLAINAATATRAGLTFQGRYTLPILAGLTFLPMFRIHRRPFADGVDTAVRQALMHLALVIITVAEVAGFWQMLRRFSVGAHGKVVLTGPLPWHPSIQPMVLIALNAVVMIALCIATVWFTRRPASQPDDAMTNHLDQSMM
ncbi:MAG: DUF2142 domain-containing protein [Ilumatobacteraceae bacterium]